MQLSTCDNMPINSIVIHPGQEYTPQNYYNSYASYQYGSYGQPAPHGQVVYYPYSVPENYRYPEEEYVTLHNSPGDSCSSTVCASVYYNVEGNNKPKCDCKKTECDRSTKRERLEFENNSDCVCKNSGHKCKSSDCCNCNKSICGSTRNSEYRCNKQKYDYESCKNDFCISRSEYDTRDCECGRNSCLENPVCKREKKKSRCSCSKCGCGEAKSDAILDSIRAVDELLKRLLLDVYDSCEYY